MKKNFQPCRHAGADDALDDGEVSETDADHGDGSRWAFLRNRPWGKVVLVTAGVLLAALGSVTVVEAVVGKPISALLRGEKGSGTTLGHHTTTKNDHQPAEDRTSTPSPSPSVTPSISSTPTPSPTSTPSSGASSSVTPSPDASATPTPTPSASASPDAGTAP